MNPLLTLLVGAALSLAGLGALVWAALVPLSRADVADHAEAESVSRTSSVAGPPQTQPDLNGILARNLLRPDRRPPPTPYRPGQPAEPQAAPPPPAPPSLVLVGVLLGSPPAAVMQGVPGSPGDRLVSLGDSVAGYVLAQLHPRSVVLIRGRDTLRLELKDLP